MLHRGDSPQTRFADQEHLDREIRAGAVLVCHLRHYGRIAALYGSSSAEDLFAAGQQHIAALCPDNAQLIRLDGPTLAVVLPEVRDHNSLEPLAHRCAAAWTVHTPQGQPPLLLTLAIGAALAGDDATNGVLSRAQLACAQAQRKPGSQVVVATANLRHQLQDTYQLEASLHLAIERRELTTHLQPIVNLSDGSPIGFECLARWPRADGTLSAPAHFLDQAIHAGISAEIDLQVLSLALEAAPQLAAAFTGDRPLVLSANISAQLVENPRKIEELLQVLEQHLHVSQVRLQLELLEESLTNSDAELDELLNALARLGVLIAIDDFGTGYSSLSRVHNLAINTIKIDRSFVERINDPHKPSNHLLQTLLAIGQDLKVDLTAEGIETRPQCEWLREHGCCHGQGFLFSQPLSVNEAIAYLHTSHTGHGLTN